MTFFIIFFCLSMELTWLSFAPLRTTNWVIRWHRWLAIDVGLEKWCGRAMPIVSVAIPCAAVAYVMLHVIEDSSLASFVFGMALLLFCSGPRDIVQDVEDYVNAYSDSDDWGAGLDQDNVLNSVQSTTTDPDEPCMRAIVLVANDGLFAPAFWFALLGPLGALFYRMSSVLGHSSALLPAESLVAERLYFLLDWLPARLLAFCLGLAGTLAPVIATFKSDGSSLGDTDRWLGNAAMAALGQHRDIRYRGDDHIAAIDAMLGLVKRGFVAFLVLLALLVAAGVL